MPEPGVRRVKDKISDFLYEIESQPDVAQSLKDIDVIIDKY